MLAGASPCELAILHTHRSGSISPPSLTALDPSSAKAFRVIDNDRYKTPPWRKVREESANQLRRYFALLLAGNSGSPINLLYSASSVGEHIISLTSKFAGLKLNDNLSRAIQDLKLETYDAQLDRADD